MLWIVLSCLACLMVGWWFRGGGVADEELADRDRKHAIEMRNRWNQHSRN